MLKHAFLYRFICCLLLITSFVSASFSVSAAPKKNIFIDVNGNPIPMDVLEFLSTNTSSKQKSSKKKQNKQKSKKKNTPVKSKKNKFSPEQEKELLETLLVGNTARATQLIRAGAKGSYKNYKGETPLNIAVSKAWASTVGKLLENGANIEQKMPSGLSLLHHATSRGYTDVAKLLVNNGLSPSRISKRKKWNSLHVAARYGRWQLVQLYLQEGVDPNARTSDGKTALEIARIVNHQGIVKILTRVTSARPVGWATRYDKRQNRLHYQAIANKKRELILKMREKIKNRQKK